MIPTDPDVLRELAIAAKVCVRPVLLRCDDTSTGESAAVPIPCGSTIARVCPSCADRARRLRMQQCREGWHRDTEPETTTDDENTPEAAHPGLGALGEPRHIGNDIDGDDTADGQSNRRIRSTKRRQDVADLPRVAMDSRTTGRVFRAPDGTAWRPSMFLTLTLPSYGAVHPDGTPVDPDTYDYRRAALDALHFAKLEDRFWQNLRRCAGYKVQYFAAVEAQRRLAPHLHAAVRGVIPRRIVRQVVAGTYHQLWWPSCDRPVYDEHRHPVWESWEDAYLDPSTGIPLPTWEEALDDLDHDRAAKPAHVLRFGRQVDYQSLIGGDIDRVNRSVAYLTKYLAKDMSVSYGDEADLTGPQVEHLRRLHRQTRMLPCSTRCANWLRYGIQPEGAKAGMEIGHCPAKAHDRHHLGLGGRRVHVSRQWSGKTLGQHAADRAAIVAATLAEAGITARAADRCSVTVLDGDGKARFVWSRLDREHQDAISYGRAIAVSIAERARWRAEYDLARAVSASATEF